MAINEANKFERTSAINHLSQFNKSICCVRLRTAIIS